MIPTTKEFINQDDYYAIISGDEYKIERVMIEFAKVHVKAALKAVAENVDLDIDSKGEDTWHTKVYNSPDNLISINKDSILNAYPEDLIK